MNIRKHRWRLLLAAAVVVLIGQGGLIAAIGAGMVEIPTSGSAQHAAQRVFDAFSAEQYGSVWDAMTAGGRGHSTREDYIARMREARPSGTARILAIEARNTDWTHVTVTGEATSLITVRIQVGFAYEDFHWRFDSGHLA